MLAYYSQGEISFMLWAQFSTDDFHIATESAVLADCLTKLGYRKIGLFGFNKHVVARVDRADWRRVEVFYDNYLLNQTNDRIIVPKSIGQLVPRMDANSVVGYNGTAFSLAYAFAGGNNDN